MPNSSRAICAVAMASLGVRQPAVLGSTATPSALIRSKKRWPGAARAVSRRSDTVTIEAPEALTAWLMTCGEGKRAVPISRREGTSMP